MLLRITVYPVIFIYPGHRNHLVDNQTNSSWKFTPKESSRPPKLDESRPQTKNKGGRKILVVRFGFPFGYPDWVPHLDSPFGLPVWAPRLGSPWWIPGTFDNWNLLGALKNKVTFWRLFPALHSFRQRPFLMNGNNGWRCVSDFLRSRQTASFGGEDE